MTDAELSALAAQIVAGLAARRVAADPRDLPLVPHQLTVREFAHCTRRHPETIREKIRNRFIAREHVFGPPYLISRDALAKFRVTLEAAASRLAAAPAPAPIPAPVPERSAA